MLQDRRLNGAGGGASTRAPNPELVERPKRRRFTAEYKLRILRDAGISDMEISFNSFQQDGDGPIFGTDVAPQKIHENAFN